MRHILRGALGVAVVYPLVWHYSSKEGVASPATGAAVPSDGVHGAERPASNRAGAAELPAAAARRAVAERLPAPDPREPVTAVEPRAPEPAAARVPAEPQPPSVQPPSVPSPSVQPPRDPLAELGQNPELKETLARAADVQQHAANPAELERALQGLDNDPAKLARLKALADMLVQLPTPRGDAYLPSSGSSASGSAAR